MGMMFMKKKTIKILFVFIGIFSFLFFNDNVMAEEIMVQHRAYYQVTGDNLNKDNYLLYTTYDKYSYSLEYYFSDSTGKHSYTSGGKMEKVYDKDGNVVSYKYNGDYGVNDAMLILKNFNESGKWGFKADYNNVPYGFFVFWDESVFTVAKYTVVAFSKDTEEDVKGEVDDYIYNNFINTTILKFYLDENEKTIGYDINNKSSMRKAASDAKGTPFEDLVEATSNSSGGNTSITDPSSIEIVEKNDCISLLGEEIERLIKNVLKTIQYLGPILVAILTIFDLIKAALGGEEEEMKKVYQKLVKRLIAAVLLFFIPLLVNFMLDLLNVTNANCNIT